MSEAFIVRHGNNLIQPGIYLVSTAAIVLGLSNYFSTGHELRWVSVWLVLVFISLLVGSTYLNGRNWWNTNVYLALQTGVILSLILLPPHITLEQVALRNIDETNLLPPSISNIFMLLFIALSGQAMLFLSGRSGYIWLGTFTLLTVVVLSYLHGLTDGVPFILLYCSGYYFSGAFVAVVTQLREAHHQLQQYAAQAEELAISRERNRLARDIHDSVTQDIYGLTMYAEAIRRLLSSGEIKTASDHLRTLGQAGEQALRELRAANL